MAFEGVPTSSFSLCDNLSYNNQADESKVTGTLKASWRIGDNVNSYASFSRGYKAGGFNLNQEAVGFRDAGGHFVDQSHFGPETSDSWELGMKARLLDGRLTVNGALFHTTFEDFQLNTYTGLGFTVGNVSEAISKGVELESSLALGGGMLLTAGATYAGRALRRRPGRRPSPTRRQAADAIAPVAGQARRSSSTGTYPGQAGAGGPI